MRRIGYSVLALFAATFCTRHADARERGFAIALQATLRVHHTVQLHDFATEEPYTTDLRSVSGHTKVATGFASTRLGPEVGAVGTYNGWLSLVPFSLAFLGEVQRYRFLTSFAGSPMSARMHVGGEFGFLGVGVRQDVRRWTFGIRVQPYLVLYSAALTPVEGGQLTKSDALNAHHVLPALRTQLEVCRRLDPTDRLCFVAAPSIVESARWFNGIGFGLRFEYGIERL